MGRHLAAYRNPSMSRFSQVQERLVSDGFGWSRALLSTGSFLYNAAVNGGCVILAMSFCQDDN